MIVFDVSLNERPIGTLVQAGKGTFFTYDDDVRNDPLAPVLSQSLLDRRGMPVDSGVYTELVPFFRNLLPENGPLRSYLSRQFNLYEFDDLGLLAVLGNDLPGAAVVTISKEHHRQESVAKSVSPESRTIEKDEQARWRFSLAGVQMKISASHAGEHWAFGAKSGSEAWILKLPTSEYPGLPDHEFAMMSLAKEVGLNVPEIQLVDVEAIEYLDERFRNVGPRAYAVQRYDRTSDTRIHQEDFCQIFALPPREKYGSAELGNERIYAVVRELCGADDAYEWLLRLAFIIAIRNGDAHLKNHSIIYPDGKNARLSPAYDFISTRYYLHQDELALRIGGEERFERIDAEALKRFAAGAGEHPRVIQRAFTDMAERLQTKWPTTRETIPDERLRNIIAEGIQHITLLGSV